MNPKTALRRAIYSRCKINGINVTEEPEANRDHPFSVIDTINMNPVDISCPTVTLQAVFIFYSNVSFSEAERMEWELFETIGVSPLTCRENLIIPGFTVTRQSLANSEELRLNDENNRGRSVRATVEFEVRKT